MIAPHDWKRRLRYSRTAHLLRKTVSVIVIAFVLFGCTVGPDYRPPVMPVGDAWIAPVETGDVDGEWWQRLDDPMLTELVDAAITGNRDIDEAGARIREARANRDAAFGRALPDIGTSVGAAENRLSENGQLPVASIPGFNPGFSLFDIGFDASWELDLWGGTRRAGESAQARLEAAEEARRGILLQVIAEVVRSYIDLREAQNLHANAVADAEMQQDIVRIIADRLRLGAASRLDLSRAQSQARSTAAAVPGLEADAAAAAIRLALLVGQPPEALFDRLNAPRPLPAGEINVAVGLRSEILRRRPDVRKAERDLAASTAEIGVATAALFPNLSLSGGIGLQARSPDDLLSSDSLRLGVGPSFSWPLFSGGRIRAQIRAADARADAAGIRYEQAVLNALADSETAINRLDAASRSRSARNEARAQALEVVGLARRRHLAGEDDLTALLQAQLAYTAAEQHHILARANELRQLASLYKALGGGWQAAETAQNR
ncbi:efflux transporter outer membrane subunit [Parasphingopyxis marina]|uniref:Efflux transporter outer membrane subunit n=1 Tax=Parasphingopyxis marina TaxID=2761622 RepID=A0A842I3U1_9SPHN|nr:efflux transporter outer membrane subunit [Parasphingopyxis marina]MBC2779150.1 efflux transporter outer membrane subunit [Parasphingopyxis marina]